MNPTSPPFDAIPAARSRVLIIDDNRDITEAMHSLLQLLDQDVRIADDGPSALRIAAEFRPEIVFLDLGLPEMDGYDVARALRKQPDGAAIHIIALSGWGDSTARQLSVEAGIDEHWLKPIAFAELHRFFTERATTARRPQPGLT